MSAFSERHYSSPKGHSFIHLLPSLPESRTSSHLEMVRATSHLTISMSGQRETGKIQRNNYHYGNCGQSLTGNTLSLPLIFTYQTHRNVKNR